MAYRVGIVGASGYTGAELVRLVSGHPELDLVLATSREFLGRRVADVYPNLDTTLAFEEFDADAAAGLDLVFLALPHGASMEPGARMAAAGTAVVDMSADFRLQDPLAYQEWYGTVHPVPETLPQWVYGLPEIYRSRIAGARAVANPGCYPTASLLALAPLVSRGIIDPASIVVSAASGVSGAGRGLSPGVHFSHVEGNFKAYGFPGHKHTPEIEQELTALAGEPVRITFVPHLVPMARGLLATCVAGLIDDRDPCEIASEFYAGERFVRVLPDALPETKFVHGSNRCLLGYRVDRRANRVVACAAIDNLGKGAAGQAVQNANLMLGVAEGAGLTGEGVYP
ncbi:MAG: N-acetyl-gamma-glutamyl-phosphate reductase [Actinomycetota bacterium]